TFADGQGHRHAPLVTALRFGQRSRRVPLDVRLHAVLTEVGTLELWCESPQTGHRWRLQFNLRGFAPAAGHENAAPAIEEPLGNQVLIADEAMTAAERLIRQAFGPHADALGPDALIGALENGLGHAKVAWPLPVIRLLADVVLDVREGR